MKVLLILLFLGASTASAQPIVSNVTAQPLADGSGDIEIFYTLSGAPESGALISVAISSDAGNSYTIFPSPTALSGHVGYGVTNGTGKKAVWHAALTMPPGTFGSTFRAAVTATATAGQEITLQLPGGIPLVLVRIPAGTFLMGSPDSERSRSSNEGPQHQVTISRDYYIGKYEVTNAQWRAVMGSLPGGGAGADTVAVHATGAMVAGAGGFLQKLNEHLYATGQVGAGTISLPTEAQWERAARGGTQTRFSFGDALDCSDSTCNYCSASLYVWWCGNNSPAGSKPVGQKAPNQFGIHDMHGGAEELTYSVGTYTLGPKVDPVTSGSFNARGGAYSGTLAGARAAARAYFYSNSNYGFRVMGAF